MPEYKSRINIKIEKICDWDKLLDIKIKEEWKLAKNAENIFREAYYRGGFIKAGDWSVDPESLEDMVECFAKTIDFELSPMDIYYLKQYSEDFIYFDTNGIEVVIPKGRNEIIAQEFAGDISVESVVIPDGVISIGERAFEDCPMLNEVVIPNSVTSIGEHAFDGCRYISIRVHKGSYAEQYAKENKIHSMGFKEDYN